MKLVIGFITYKDMTAKYLPYFLPSLKNQALKDCEIIAFDNSEDQDDLNIKYLHEYNIAYERAGKNIGFARAYNKLIRQAVDWQADYFLVLNPDMLVEPGAIQRMADALELDENLGS
ncbi:MAG: glycosyltransferase, partial [Patescibacteria group bacterium]|nr:glycosyltransferase [Patescibacteria group bacterium]